MKTLANENETVEMYEVLWMCCRYRLSRYFISSSSSNVGALVHDHRRCVAILR